MQLQINIVHVARHCRIVLGTLGELKCLLLGKLVLKKQPVTFINLREKCKPWPNLIKQYSPLTKRRGFGKTIYTERKGRWIKYQAQTLGGLYMVTRIAQISQKYCILQGTLQLPF